MSLNSSITEPKVVFREAARLEDVISLEDDVG